MAAEPSSLILHVTATVETEEHCPLYREKDALVFVPPGVHGVGYVSVCATAVERLHPVVRMVRDGKIQARDPIYCGGCAGRAWFRLEATRVVPAPAHPPGFEDTALEALSSMSLFSGVSRSQLRRIVPLLRSRIVPREGEIRKRGEPADGLYFIVKGECEVYSGDEHLPWVLHEGECFGVTSLLTGGPGAASVRARTDVALLWIAREQFPVLLSLLPSLVPALARVLASRLSTASRWVTDEFKKGIAGRLGSIATAELVHALYANTMTGTLEARRGRDFSALVFVDGQVVRAICGDLEGEEAFYEFLGWTTGSFRFDPQTGGGLEQRMIERDTMALLLEGMRRRDESKHDGGPPGGPLGH